MTTLSRRQFVVAAVGACGACALTLEALAQAPSPVAPVVIGKLDDFPKDGIYDQFVARGRFFVMRREGRLFATSATCTHKRNLVRKVGEKLVCAKHGSEFSEFGTVLEGPASMALPRFKISRNDDGTITVDPSVSFGEREWDKPETFVACS